MDNLTEVLSAGGQGILLVIIVLAIVMLLRTTIRAVKEYDRLVIFFIGRVSGGARSRLDLRHSLRGIGRQG